jgi:hypothetical protein
LKGLAQNLGLPCPFQFRAWQAQFLSYTPVTLKFYVFFIDVQMIFLPFFDNPKQKPVNQEKMILSFWFILPAVQFGQLVG